jgi:hypothetical protein
VRIANPPALRYYAYTVLLPPFDPALGALPLLLAVPTLIGTPPAVPQSPSTEPSGKSEI